MINNNTIKLAELFRKMALMYRYSGNENRFRALSYEKAARSIENLKEDITLTHAQQQLKNRKGIGKSIRDKIIEYLKSGRIAKYDELEKQTPLDLIELMKLRGFGPKTLKLLHDELGISNQEQLSNAIHEGKLDKIKGIGLKKIKVMQEGLQLHENYEKRILLWDAMHYAEAISNWFKKCNSIVKYEFAGSLRRKKETIGDLDLVVCCEENDIKKVIQHLTDKKFSKKTLLKGNEKLSVILKDDDIQLDVIFTNKENFGSALQHFTGSKEHNIHLRTIAQKNGFKLSEYGIEQLKNNKMTKYDNEKAFYEAISYDWIPPELREDKGEIDKAEQHQLPDLIKIDDMKGDLQMHSNWSDGAESILNIANYIKQHFKYDYISITDHSKSSHIAHGITEKQLEKQMKEIRQVNQILGEDFVLTGIEVDILANGDLDFSDELLQQLDWVTASIHSGFSRDNTDRIINACRNKYVDCIGHPTGRLIGTRNPYPIQMNEVFKVAKETGTAFEINAQPNRMDLNENYARQAKELGIPLVINTDAHRMNEFEFMKLGIALARRAWCEKKDILNTFSWKKIKNWKTKRKGIQVQEVVF